MVIFIQADKKYETNNHDIVGFLFFLYDGGRAIRGRHIKENHGG